MSAAAPRYRVMGWRDVAGKVIDFDRLQEIKNLRFPL